MERIKNHLKIRKTVSGSAVRPRLAAYRSLNNIFTQLIDDNTATTLAQANSLKLKGSLSKKAEAVGRAIAKAALAKKIKTVVFDRGGFQYKGTIKILAESARSEGLEI